MQKNYFDIAAELIQTLEGFSSTIYKCSAGVDTFGYGSLVRNYPDMKFPVTQRTALECLKKDLRVFDAAIYKLIKVDLNAEMRAALLSFTYNLGIGCLQHSTLRMKLNRGEYFAVTGELRKYNKVKFEGKYKIIRGLDIRRKAEAKLYDSGLIDFLNG